MSGQEDIYVVQWLLTGEKPLDFSVADTEKYVGENLVNFMKFFVDNYIEGDGEMNLSIK
jgi:hypothetical protein